MAGHIQVEQPMHRDLGQHVVEEADAGVDVVLAGAVQVERDLDAGFGGGAGDLARGGLVKLCASRAWLAVSSGDDRQSVSSGRPTLIRM